MLVEDLRAPPRRASQNSHPLATCRVAKSSEVFTSAMNLYFSVEIIANGDRMELDFKLLQEYHPMSNWKSVFGKENKLVVDHG